MSGRTYVVERLKYYSMPVGSRLFKDRSEAETFAESWVLKNEAACARLTVYGKKGRPKTVLKFGATNRVDYAWSKDSPPPASDII